MDFTTNLLDSSGFSIICVVVDCFSKMAHIVALKEFPSATSLFLFVNREYFKLGIPMNVVSDREVKFTSKFSHVLFSLLEVKQTSTRPAHLSQMTKLKEKN